jgi:hypothetical protein
MISNDKLKPITNFINLYDLIQIHEKHNTDSSDLILFRST